MNKKEKESSGTKSVVKIQVWKVKPINENSWKNIPQCFHKMSDGLTKTPMHVITVKVVDISNKDKLAYVIRKHYGFGRFMIMFWNRWNKSSNYNPNFKCLEQQGKECLFKTNGKCKIWKRHKKGWTCKKNRKISPNWSKRCELTIYPKNTYTEYDYDYKWNKREDKMFYFRKWFWQDTRR